MIFSSSAKDFWYVASSSTLTYYIEVDGNPIYWGKAVSTTGNASINIGKRVSDYLEIDMPDFRNYSGVVVPHPKQLRVFNLCDEDGNILESYTVMLDADGSWAGQYGPIGYPVNGHADPRQKVFWTTVEETETSVPVVEPTVMVKDNQVRVISICNQLSVAGAGIDTSFYNMFYPKKRQMGFEKGFTDNTFNTIKGIRGMLVGHSSRTNRDLYWWDRYSGLTFYEELKHFYGGVPFALDYFGTFEKKICGVFRHIGFQWGEWRYCPSYSEQILAVFLPKSIQKVDPDFLNVEDIYSECRSGYAPGETVGPSYPYVYFSGTVRQWENIDGGEGFAEWTRDKKIYCMDGVYTAP